MSIVSQQKNTVLAFCMNVTPHVRNVNVRTGGENWYCGQVFAVSVILKLFNRQRKRIVHAAWSCFVSLITICYYLYSQQVILMSNQ